jgi:Ni/Fe-hydrogenase 1 B-type cytochrome subunit
VRPIERPTELARVYVWEWPVRATHWVVATAVLVLAATGFTISHPPGPWAPLGTVKAIHSYAAIAFTLAFASRLAWMFLGNRWARWDQFLPVTRERRNGLAPTLRYYLFMLRKPPGYIGHNPLAGATYTLVLLLELLMITTGFALYSASAPYWSPMRAFRVLIPALGGLQTARWIHHAGMWLLIGFVVHHVYSAVLMSQVEANATVESIFSGYKFVPEEDVLRPGARGAAPATRA